MPQAVDEVHLVLETIQRGEGGAELHGRAVVVGVDRELAAFEQRLHAAVAEFLRRLAAQLCGHLHQESGLQRPVEDQPGIAFDLGDVIAVVMNAVAVEG